MSTNEGARAEILTRIRAGLRDVTTTGDLEPPIPWEYGRPTPMAGILDRFAERVSDYRASVVRCTPDDVPDRIASSLQGAGVLDVVVPAEVDPSWQGALRAAGITVRSDEPRLTHVQLDDTGAVLTGAAVAIAETGTIVLDHGPDQGRRALSLVPDVHVCVVRADQVVSDVPEAVARLADAVREHRPLTWISGPSATSDIELDRVEGVHGPRTLVVVLAG